jgi:hypothetical protein
MYEIMKTKMSEFAEKDSGWILTNILYLEINLNNFTPLRGSTYLKLPRDIIKKKAVLNIENEDNECFKWSILAAIHRVTDQ